MADERIEEIEAHREACDLPNRLYAGYCETCRCPWPCLIRRLAAALGAAERSRERLRAALENIQVNVKGLVGGMVPGIGKDALWYFKNILAVCNDALAAAEHRPDAGEGADGGGAG